MGGRRATWPVAAWQFSGQQCSAVTTVRAMAAAGTREAVRLAAAADDAYAAPAVLALITAALAASQPPVCALFAIDLSPGVVAKVEAAFRQAGIAYEIRPVDMVALSRLPSGHRGGATTFARIVVPGILAPHAARTLFIDSDTVTVGAIDELLGMPMDGRAVAAVRDPVIGVVGHPWGIPRWADHGLAADEPYFNAGVMLIDNDRWVDERIAERVFGYLRALPPGSPFHDDQRGLNTVLAGTWLQLDARWNRQAQNRFALRILSWEVTVARVRRRREGCIIHYINVAKPWQALYPPNRDRQLYQEAWVRHLADVFPHRVPARLVAWLVRRIVHGPPEA